MRIIKFRAWEKPYSFTDVFDGFSGKMHYDIIQYLPTRLYSKDYEIMQFTGLKENAHEETELNKEIYEGDFVQFINGEMLEVEWNDDTCQWQFSDGSPINDGERYATYKAIVGNIYENSELSPS